MKVKTMSTSEIQDVLDSFRAPDTPARVRDALQGIHPGMFHSF